MKPLRDPLADDDGPAIDEIPRAVGLGESRTRAPIGSPLDGDGSVRDGVLGTPVRGVRR